MPSTSIPPGPMGGRVLPPLAAHDGLSLFRRHWPRPEARASVLLVHGLGEHSGRYQALAEWFWKRGYEVQAYDQRGHGRSGGPRGGLPARDDLLEDLAQVYADFARGYEKPPLLLGHSMGGLVCARAVLDGRIRPSALILSAPALKSRVGSWLQWLAGGLAGLVPALPMRQGLPRSFLSHEPSVAPAVRVDPYCHDRITPALADFIFKTGPRCLADAAHLALPTLLLVAGDDKLVDAQGCLGFAAAAPSSRLQLQVFASAYHELFNEIASIREPVLATVAGWLEAGGWA